jgi:hypothetical protein
MGKALFIGNITRVIVVHIGAILLLRNASFRTFVYFRRTLYCFFGMILSVVDCRQSGFSYIVE